MKTLTRYLGREVLAAILLIFTALVMLFAFFDLIKELGDVGRGDYTISTALLFVVLQLPSRMYELFPVAALIGTLFALAQLVANSEYTVMRASGASLGQVAWSLVRIGIPLALVMFLAGEFVAPPAEWLAQKVRAQAKGDNTRVVAQQFRSGFWFKQDQAFVNIRSVLPNMTLVDVTIYEFDDELRLRTVRNAGSGSFAGNGKWRLNAVRATEISPTAIKITTSEDWMWETVLRPSLLTVYQVAPERLELTTRWENMRVLGAGAQKTTRFEIAFWNKIFFPAAVIVMMILALPFSYFQRRQGGIGSRIFAGTMLGLTFFLVGRLFSNLGVLNNWSLFSAVFRSWCWSLIMTLWWLEGRRRGRTPGQSKISQAGIFVRPGA
jgi:lipopolysaccharide export system permease protein